MVFFYKIEVAYDGSNFHGFQSQKNVRNVQDELEKAISRLNSGTYTKVKGAGRTDALVHARNQVVTFETNKAFKEDYFLLSVNRLLPSDIHVYSIKEINPDFHVRYHAYQKHYQYRINLGDYDVFKERYDYQYNKALDIQAMKDASLVFIGRHDFRSYSSATSDQETIRDIFDIKFSLDNEVLVIDYYGSGFLKYMVRKLTKALLDVGRGKLTKEEIQTILDKKDINAYSKIISGCGLYLMKVYYKEEDYEI